MNNLNYKGCPIEYDWDTNTWYVWDETWTTIIASCKTKAEAIIAEKDYCRNLEFEEK